jgi:hypothetical protein
MAFAIPNGSRVNVAKAYQAQSPLPQPPTRRNAN